MTKQVILFLLFYSVKIPTGSLLKPPLQNSHHIFSKVKCVLCVGDKCLENGNKAQFICNWREKQGLTKIFYKLCNQSIKQSTYVSVSCEVLCVFSHFTCEKQSRIIPVIVLFLSYRRLQLQTNSGIWQKHNRAIIFLLVWPVEPVLVETLWHREASEKLFCTCCNWLSGPRDK